MPVRALDRLAAEVRTQPAGDQGEPRLGLERVVGCAQRPVQGADGAAQGGLVEVRLVHGPAGQPLVQDLGAEVEDALAEPDAGRSPAVHDTSPIAS